LNKPFTDSCTVIRNTLARTRLFGDWPAEVLDELAAASTLRSFHNGEAILRAGKPSGHMVVVAKGTLLSQRTLPSGKVVVFDFLLPGQTTSHIAVLDGFPPANDCIAKGEADVILVPRESIMKVIRHDADRLFDVVQYLCRRTRFDYEAVLNATGISLRCRIAKMLVWWARGWEEPSAEGFQVPMAISQDDLAALMGRSRQTINRELVALTRDGVLARNYRRLTVIDVAKLTEIIDSEDPGTPEMRAALFERPKHTFKAAD